MQIVWNNGIRAIHSDDQNIRDKYPDPILRTSVEPVYEIEYGQFGEVVAKRLAAAQDPQFVVDTGLEYVNGAWTLSTAGVARSRVDEVMREASRRRNILMGSPPDDADTAMRNFLSLTARATGKARREAKGRGKLGEAAELDHLEALTDGLEAIDNARDSIIAEVQASPDPSSIDIPNHPSWP